MHLLTVSGSLRTGSSNAALLDAAARVAPDGITVSRYSGLARIPAFNPDLVVEDQAAPVAVAEWREALVRADAVLISSPEYAHGIPGAVKNALDWVVATGELVGKPVGILSGSAASRFAHGQLVEVLTVMSALVVPDATRVIDIPRRGADSESLLGDRTIARALTAAVGALLAACAHLTSGCRGRTSSAFGR